MVVIPRFGQSGRALQVGLLAVLWFGSAFTQALAVPSFAIQTGQPCAACHVGAFGPQLKPYGRDFKINGYVATDNQDKSLPIAMVATSSFTKTAASQEGGAAPGFKPNNNVALDEISLFYAGRVARNVGAFVEVTLDGITGQPQLGATDIRAVRNSSLFGSDVLWGLSVNNNPSMQDPWNSMPAWSFPYGASPLAPTPAASTLIDGNLAERVLGASAYMWWNDMLYVEAGGYSGLSRQMLNATGKVPVAGTDQLKGLIPYGRVALVGDWEKHHIQVGTFGLMAGLIPGGEETFGFTNRFRNLGLDATWQYIANPKSVASDMVSAHATFIRQDARLDASEALTGALPKQYLETLKFDISYSFAATLTPSFGYFRTSGTRDPNYWDTRRGIPNSEGMIYEIAYVPWGKPDSPKGVNAKLAVQYTDYFRFDGSRRHASRNNSIYVSLSSALKF